MDAGGMDEEWQRSLKESKTLAGIFSSIVQDCKSLHPLIDDFIIKSSKLENQLKATILAFSAFNESFEKIAYKACNTKGSSRDVGACLIKMCDKQKEVETQLSVLSNFIAHRLVIDLKSRNEENKKKTKILEKKHKKEFKQSRNKIRRKMGKITKLREKVNKENKSEIRKQIEEESNDLHTEHQVLENQERQAVRRINLEERSQFCQFAACVGQVVEEEVAVMGQIESIKDVLDTMGTIIADPLNIPDTRDVMNNIMESGTKYSFDTPTSSVNGSLRGSRCGSLTSINSLVQPRLPRSSSVDRILRISLYSEDDTTSTYSTEQDDTQSTRSLPRARKDSSSSSRHVRDDSQTFSTVRRAHSPFRKLPREDNTPDQTDKECNVTLTRRPPLPRRNKPVDRPEETDRLPPLSRSDRGSILAIHQDDTAGQGEKPSQETPGDSKIINELTSFKQTHHNLEPYLTETRDTPEASKPDEDVQETEEQAFKIIRIIKI